MNTPRTDAAHARIAELLPWYVNGTLAAQEREAVRQHLESCADCRDGVALLDRMRAAVRRPRATPIVPPADAERLLASIRRRPGFRGFLSRHRAVVAAAAALAAVTFVIGLIVAGGMSAPPQTPRYETLTGSADAPSMDYVLDLQFETGLTPAARDRVLDGLAASQVHAVHSGDTYRVTLNLQASSLEELERVMQRVEAMPEIRSVRAVAMQLPVRNPPP